MLNIKHRSFLIYCILLATQITFSQLKRSPEITKDELFQHVKYLASDALEGRLTGTTGADKAADYIAAEFKFYGLKPIGANNTYYQNFDFIADVELGKRNSFAYSSLDKKESFKFQKDFQPLAFSSS